MAFHKLVSAIQAARSVLFGRMNEGIDVGQLSTFSHWWDVVRGTTDIWFTPDIVKDYDDAEFLFLPSEQQVALRRAVDEFRRTTQEAQGSSPTEAQIQEGYDLFATINNIIAPLAGEEPDLQRIREVIHSVQWPSYIFGADCRIGADSTGDPAVWIWLILKDDVEIESPSVQAELNRIRGAYRDAIQKAGINRWPYVSVRTRSETKDLIAGAA